VRQWWGESSSWTYASLHSFIHSSRLIIDFKASVYYIWIDSWLSQHRINEGVDGKMKKSMSRQNEEKLSGQTCAYVGRWGPKNGKYSDEFLYFSSIIPDSVWCEYELSRNRDGSQRGPAQTFLSFHVATSWRKGCQL
jgi:hypothetical protein